MAITKVSRNLLNTGVSDSSDATAITINSSEQVGIGTTSPVATLQVKTQADGNLAFQNSTSVTGGVKLNCFNDAANASSPFEIDGSTLQFNIGSTERMRIDSSGNVLVGNTNGLAKFCVGNGSGNALIEMASSSATAVYYEHINRSNVSGNCNVGYYARAAGEHTFYTGSYTARFIINSSGGSNASDEKLKENIQNLSYGLDTVKSLKPRQFKWKDNQQQSIGFVAQEVES